MKSKSLPEMEKAIATVSDIYADRFGIERDKAWYLAKMTEELGELAAADLRLSKKARPNGSSKAELEEALASEAADLFAHLVLFCRDRGISLQDAVHAKWLKHLPEEASQED
ncbi:pyrophosphatase [uncultured Roseibium sp.]|uniref:pyrophosphatase n=1 Tax=uncultured Roseibium sp. TaxID=1936171 RepID=UPI002633B9BE|nr:pyrophosphatase [uncultured Roseibium sp.]